jgi:hypothetical protein
MTIPSRLTTPSGFAAMIVIGLLLAASDTALAGGPNDTTRDHRGGKQHPGATATQGGVTVNGQSTTATKPPTLPLGSTGPQTGHSGGYGGLEGKDYGKGDPAGATVRDHR